MADTGSVIHTESLTKFYGKNRGILDVSLDIGRGEVFGYLGPNGAGKTTTIRTLLQFIRPTRGRSEIFGMDIRRNVLEPRRRIGYLPGELEVYDNLTGAELLEFLGHLRGGVDWQYITELAARLDYDLSQRIKTLSHGNRQKIGLVQAFMSKPELLILDEPTIGLDPLMQQEFYRLIGEVKAEGRTVFLSSHIMPEVERVCDRVGIIREGQLIAVEDIDTLKARAIRRLEIRFATPVSPEQFSDIAGVRDVQVHDNVLTCTVAGELDALVKVTAQHQVVNVISHEPSMEEIFLAYYNQENNGAA
ncbi:MAG: ABC transporter ATP-binding protein [Dehalococcoidales bacterium]|nr:MAG: ABC transporter ATP-binding protein [Dehalococcoidales bacterium]